MGLTPQDYQTLQGKRVYFDANPLIYGLSGDENYLEVITQIFSGLNQQHYQGYSSELGLAELLVKPLQENNLAEIQTIKELFDKGFLGLLSHNRVCFELASQIRARYRLKMPDAIHVATAIFHNMDVFITADNNIANRIAEITMLNLNDYKK